MGDAAGRGRRPSRSESSESSETSSSSSDSGSESPSRSPRRPRRDERADVERRGSRDSKQDMQKNVGAAGGPGEQPAGEGPGPSQAQQTAGTVEEARRSVFDRLGGGSGVGDGSGGGEPRRQAQEGSGRGEQPRRDSRRDDDADRPDRSHRDAAPGARGGRGDREGDRRNDERYERDRRDPQRYGRHDDGDRYRSVRDGGDDDRWRGDWEDQGAAREPERYRRREEESDRDRDRDRERYGGHERSRPREHDRDREDRGRDGHRGREYDREGRDRRDDDRSPRKRRRGDDDDGDRADRRQAELPRGREQQAGGAAGGTERITAEGGGDAAQAAAGAGPGAEAAVEAVARKPVALGKSGGVYIPPFKLARMMAEQGAQDKSSPEYQRLTWEALKKSLNGIINKVNVVNVKNILPEVFRENLIRGRGLLCRSLMKSQAASPAFTPVYAALVAVVNTKFPEIGELLLSRLILQFKRSFKRNDKPVCTAAAKFIAHLVNQGVAHEVLALEVLILLLEQPSEDSVEMAVEFVKEVGAHLQEVAPQGLHGVFERFRAILHEGTISKRVQFIIEGMFALRKAGFEASGFPALKPELDLVEAEDQITHEMGLDDTLQAQTNLDVFRVDPEYEDNERKYAAIVREILGEEEDEEEEGGGGEAGASEPAEEESSDEEDDGGPGGGDGGGRGGILDETATNLVNLRRTIYLTLMSSFDFEEAGHKLLKIGIQPGQEIELVTMIIECCSQERTFKRFYGLLAQRFCYLSRAYAEQFEDCFRKQYSVIHRLETNKLRNVSCLFAHLLATDALPWSALTAVVLTEEDTTSSSRIFIKYLFQELSSTMGLVKLNQRLNDPAFAAWFEGIFPRDSLQHMRFSINFFTSIGLGGVTDVMREHYKQTVTAQAAAQQQQVARRMLGDGSGSSSSSSSDDSSSSSSESSSSDESSSSGSDSDSQDSRGRRRGRRKSSGSKKGKEKKDGGREKKRRR